MESEALGDALSLYVSNICAAAFERAACEAVELCKRDLCPWAGSITPIQGRNFHADDEADDEADVEYAAEADIDPDEDHLDAGGAGALQADILAYCEEDDSGPCCDVLLSGLRVLLPTGKSSLTSAHAAPAAAGGAGSSVGSAAPMESIAASAASSDKARISVTGGMQPLRVPSMKGRRRRKCLIGLAYSGSDVATMEAKAHQLDTLLRLAVQRFQDKHPDATAGKATDVTEVIGAAVLVFCAAGVGSDSDSERRSRRAVALATAEDTLRRCIDTGSCATLRRLSQAGRLAVMVLGGSDAPLALTYRGLCDLLTGPCHLADETDGEHDRDG